MPPDLPILPEQDDNPGFVFPEDYTLFGLLILHGLCLPGDFLTLVMAQRREVKPRLLLEVLAETNSLTEKQKSSIAELIRVLSEPKLRAMLPANLPAVETIRADLEATVRVVQQKAAKSIAEAATVVSLGPTVRSVGLSMSTQTALSYTSGEFSTRLTKDEIERIEKSRTKGGKLVGQVIAGNVIIDRLGSGGQGDVYLAKQLSLNRYIAMKSLEAPRGAPMDQFISFFRQEAETLGRINHARIVKVFEIFEADGRAYFTMEHIQGKTIRDLVHDAKGPLPIEVVSNLACQACSAFSRTSEDGLVHRDIKPANMMLDENGDLKIVDFGLAGATTAFADGAESFAGTPHFASPEQAEKRAITPKSDQYSLGLTLYYALTGVTPVQGKTLQEVLFKQVSEKLPPPSEANNAIPRSVDRVVMRMIEKDPNKRFDDFTACYEAWQEVLLESTSGRLAGSSQLLGENLLRVSREEGKTIAKNAVSLAFIFVGFTAIAVFGEGQLRAAGMEEVLKFCGDWGTYILCFSLACIGYVAMARRKMVPLIGDFRAWLYTHIATAIISIAMLLLHSGHFLRGLMPNGQHPKPVLSILSALALLITAISGVTGLVLFRALQKRIQMEQLKLRGQRSSEKEKMVVALGARALSGWRLVHYPIAVFFVVVTILHILASLRFSTD